MLSLSNAFGIKDLENFEKKIFNYLNKRIDIEYSVEPKIDGISASLKYIDGIFYADEVFAKHDENYMPPNLELN